MFKKKNRLPAGVLKPEKVFNTKEFTLKVSKNNEGESRFGLVVSKKIDKRATVRNKTKRALRKIFEDRFTQIKPGLDFLIIAKGTFEEGIESKLNNLLKKEGYLK